VIGLARTFGCVVVAEGVESPAQARTLLDMGCDIGQGTGIAAPDAGRAGGHLGAPVQGHVRAGHRTRSRRHGGRRAAAV
jgi:EAL domain-containing protein (putative c-di-GMP-specific phosphodiesterase class I)